MYKARFCHSPQGARGSPPFPTAFHPLSDTLLETELPIRMGMVPLLPARSTPARSIPACPLPTQCPRGPAPWSPSQCPPCTLPGAAAVPAAFVRAARWQAARPSFPSRLCSAGAERCRHAASLLAPKRGAGLWLLPAPGRALQRARGLQRLRGARWRGQAGWRRSPSLSRCLGVSVISLRGQTCRSQSSPDHQAQMQLDLLHRKAQ